MATEPETAKSSQRHFVARPQRVHQALQDTGDHRFCLVLRELGAFGDAINKLCLCRSGFTNLSSMPCSDLGCWGSYEDTLPSTPRSKHRASVPGCGGSA